MLRIGFVGYQCFCVDFPVLVQWNYWHKSFKSLQAADGHKRHLMKAWVTKGFRAITGDQMTAHKLFVLFCCAVILNAGNKQLLNVYLRLRGLHTFYLTCAYFLGDVFVHRTCSSLPECGFWNNDYCMLALISRANGLVTCLNSFSPCWNQIFTWSQAPRAFNTSDYIS